MNQGSAPMCGALCSSRAPADGPPEPEVHPLFPPKPSEPGRRRIAHLTLRRRQPDGRVEVAPEEYDPRELRSWRHIWDAWGGGDYQIIAKDAARRIVAWEPSKTEWMSFETPPRPFERRNGFPWPTPGRMPADHPAARPGTGLPVEWYNDEIETLERHAISPWMRCLVCGWYKDLFDGGGCFCGALNWENLEPEAPPRLAKPDALRALGDAGTGRICVDHYEGAALATVLEGIGRGLTVLLVGPAGVGKSTLAAQASFLIAQQLDQIVYWLDADQLRWELIEETFARAQCPPTDLPGRILPVYAERPDGLPDPGVALAKVPEDAVVVVDSLEAWAPRGDKQALELLRALRVHPARVKIVIAATNADGGVAGDGELERAGDATVFVERTRLRVGKCRWAVGATWARCGTLGLEVERLDDAGRRVSADGDGEEPDFSPAFLTTAATWSVREIEAYRARLRAHGVPRDSILGWDRAVEEQRAGNGPATGGFKLVPLRSHTRLSEEMEGAYALLMRFWPWTEPVRAQAIAQALPMQGFGALSSALRDLLGGHDGTDLSATEVGNALKVVRDVVLDGKRLTRELDRKGVARWSVVNDEYVPEGRERASVTMENERQTTGTKDGRDPQSQGQLFFGKLTREGSRR